MKHHCFALLDDASNGAGATAAAPSRLYTGHLETLACDDIAAWPALLLQMQRALDQGRHAVALCAYELGVQLQGLAALRPREQAAGAPLAQILLFERCQQLSRSEVDSWLEAQAKQGDAEYPAGVANVRTNLADGEFGAALERIHGYIEAGDTYQINYTYRLRFDCFGAPAALYARLRARQPVPYGALITLADGGAVLSLSPELFVRHQGGQLTARPMKGTAQAAPDSEPEENARRAAELAADPKNRAENLMIVDLLRNDIGRVARTGTVSVPRLFEVQRYSSVLQMTSTVNASLRENTTLADIFAALYPCGSITGAPKRRSMEIIDELEADARGLYTGAIGWFDAPAAAGGIGDFCMSVPIRTLVLQPPQDGVRNGEMGVGAGIVFDSDTTQEYAECQLKARFLTGLENRFELFETMHASRPDGVRHVERHLARLAASAACFGFACEPEALREQLRHACATLPDDSPHRMRLALDQAGKTTLTHAPLVSLIEPVRLLLAPAQDCTDTDQLFLRHKTTERAAYDAGWRAAEQQGGFDTLFFNQRGELGEGGRSNVFIKLEGRWYTPPLSAGVLPGVMRAVLLDDPSWAATERTLTLAMLEKAEEIVVCNALRGPLRATLK